MEAIREFGEWWNLIYVVPFCAGILVTALSVLGMGRLGGRHSFRFRGGHGGTHSSAGAPGAGARGSHAGGRAAGARASGSSPRLSPRAGGQPGAKAGAQSGAKPGAARTGRGGDASGHILALVGVGKVPFPVIFQSLLISWGFVGCLANQLYTPLFRSPALFILPSLATAFFGAMLFTRVMAEGLGRVTPQADETYALEAEDLVGTVGEAVFRVDGSMGSVHVYDETGALHELRARCRPGVPAIEKGEQALVVDYDAANRRYWVERWEAAR